jgi:hypothetical protein
MHQHKAHQVSRDTRMRQNMQGTQNQLALDFSTSSRQEWAMEECSQKDFQHKLQL